MQLKVVALKNTRQATLRGPASDDFNDSTEAIHDGFTVTDENDRRKRRAIKSGITGGSGGMTIEASNTRLSMESPITNVALARY